jgi:cytochrome c oxidase subunit 2
MARTRRIVTTATRWLFLGLAMSVLPVPVRAAVAVAVDTTGRGEPLPDDLRGVGITEHLNARLPLDLEFTDDEGRAVRLGDYFHGHRPVIFNLAYYTCPMLCTLVLNGVVESTNQLDWTLGEQFENVTVSIDPSETPALAKAKKENYLHTYKKAGAADHWHFLVGRPENITRLAEAAGFGYRYDPTQKQFIHAAVTMVVTPDGRLSRYLYGIECPPQTLRLALLEAGQGKIGNTIDKLVLYCYHYDPSVGRYSPAAIRIMQVGGALTAGVLGVLLFGLRLGERRRRRERGSKGKGASGGAAAPRGLDGGGSDGGNSGGTGPNGAAGIIAALAFLPAALLAGAGRALAQERPYFWLPQRASTESGRVDWLFNFILVISLIFFLLVVTFMVFFVVRYRRRPGRGPEQTSTHNLALELTWSIIPFALLVLMFAFGFKTYLDMNMPPRNAIPILVTGQKWAWQFTYPNGYVDGVLHVPVNTPISLTLSSEDVIHSFYVPDFRVKKDVVPGRYNTAWFQATTPGTFPVYCAEYCGSGHSDMLTSVVVHEPGGYETWLDDVANFVDKIPPAQAGERIFQGRGCTSCHSVDGRTGVGPTLQGVFGTQVILANGSKVLADENYIRESILEPAAKTVAGFDPVMPTYQGRIKDKEITVIIEYLKTLK